MKFFVLIIGLLLINQLDAKQKYYKWTDADGNTHYSETKPPDQTVDEVKVSTSRPKAVNYDTDETAEEPSEDSERTAEQKEIDEYNKAEKERTLIAQNKANCVIAKKNLKTLQDTVRVKRRNPATGEYIRMDDTQRMQMMKKIKQSIKDLCK
jgi:hypothetical protein